MKANELRLGNYYDNHGNIEMVTPNTILELFISDRSWIKPIPLTEEWLFRFGFEERKETDNFSKWGIGDNPKTSDWILLIKQFKDDNIFFYQNGYHKIQHVYQLQNLYHALTGEELKIIR